MPRTNLISYVAFLRGINVGGKVLVKMDDLKKAFTSLGFQNVRTVLASGNIVFEAAAKDSAALVKQIEQKLGRMMKRDIHVLIRTVTELQELADSRPFGSVDITPQTRLYVTFFSEKPKNTPKFPFPSAEMGLNIVHASESEACSVVTVTPGQGTADFMKVLEKLFGKKVTTRNWNTIEKIVK